MTENNLSNAGQGLGIASFVLGLIALVISFIPCVGWVFAIVPAMIAAILGFVAYSQAKGSQSSKGLIIAGIVVSMIAFIYSAAWGLFFVEGTDHLKDSVEQFEENWEEELQNINIDAEDQEEINEAIEKIENAIDSVDVDEMDIRINDEELSDEEKEKLKNSAKVATRKIGKAIQDFSKEIKDLDDKEEK